MIKSTMTGLGFALSLVMCSGCESTLIATAAVGDAMFGTNEVFVGTGNSRDEAYTAVFNNARAAGFAPHYDGHHDVVCNQSFGSWRCEGNIRGVW